MLFLILFFLIFIPASIKIFLFFLKKFKDDVKDIHMHSEYIIGKATFVYLPFNVYRFSLRPESKGYSIHAHMSIFEYIMCFVMLYCAKFLLFLI